MHASAARVPMCYVPAVCFLPLPAVASGDIPGRLAMFSGNSYIDRISAMEIHKLQVASAKIELGIIERPQPYADELEQPEPAPVIQVPPGAMDYFKAAPPSPRPSPHHYAIHLCTRSQMRKWQASALCLPGRDARRADIICGAEATLRRDAHMRQTMTVNELAALRIRPDLVPQAPTPATAPPPEDSQSVCIHLFLYTSGMCTECVRICVDIYN